MTTATIAGIRFDLDAEAITAALVEVAPEPLREHYAVVGGRRYPPKQVVAVMTGLDRADFTTHQARAVLRRLGIGVYRLPGPSERDGSGGGSGPDRAAHLRPFVGRWVAQTDDVVLFDADSPEEVVTWLRCHNRKARVWRVPASPAELGSSLTAPSS